MSILGWLFPGKTGVNEMKAFTKVLNDGRTGLYRTDGTLVSSFARSRDASRGAARRGLTLIN